MTSPGIQTPASARLNRSSLAVIAAVIVTIIGIMIAGYAISRVNPGDSDALGLISALPWFYFVGMAMVIFAFVFALGREKLNRPLLSAQLVAVVVLMYGVACASEDVARLPTTWVHVGFVDYIQRTGELRQNFDARFAWPGFFTTIAMLNLFAGRDAQPVVYEWAPVALNVLFLLPIWLIARGAGASVRASWLAALLFALTNWVAQDYFSPQGLNLLLALSFIAVLLHVFAKQSPLVPRALADRLPGVLGRIVTKLRPGTPPATVVSSRDRILLLIMLCIIFVASVASHQLTPFFLIVITLGLVLLNRLSVRRLPLFMLLVVFMWIAYAATSFWAGNINTVFGDVGQVGGVVDQSVSSRVKGDPAHLPVVYGRLALTVFVWLLALVGFLRRLVKGHIDLVCIVGFIAPFSVLGGQAYGGEAMLRVYLFALPFAVTLGAQAFAIDNSKWSKKRSVATALMGVILVPMFFVARHGNEAFEHFTRAEMQIVEQTYAVAPKKSMIITLNSLAPTRAADIENFDFRAIAEDGPPVDQVGALDAMVASAKDENTYFIVTRAQSEYAQLTHGQSKTWAKEYVKHLIDSGRYRLLMQNSDGQVLVPMGQS